MKTMRTIAVAGCSMLLLTQCASQDDVRDLQYQLRAVNQKVEDVRNNAVDQMQKRQASSVSKNGKDVRTLFNFKGNQSYPQWSKRLP